MLTVTTLGEMYDLLYYDVDTASFNAFMKIDQFTEEEQLFWRRTYIRSLFSFIEGVVFSMKQVALEKYESTDIVLSVGEVALLREESYDLDDRGAVKDGTAKITMLKNIKFTFNMLPKAYNSTYNLPIGLAGWDALRQSAKVRDRLMHPKTIDDLTISFDELLTASKAQLWFVKSFSDCLATITPVEH